MATKSLLNKTSKPKKPKSQSKKANKNVNYQFEIGDVLVYLGSVIESQNKQECTVISRSRNHIQCSYKVEFSSGEVLECIPDVLQFVSDYEEELERLELGNGDQEDTNKMSDEEKRIIESGEVPYLNRLSCFNQVAYYERRCESCNKYGRCIYINKGKYKKLDNN